MACQMQTPNRLPPNLPLQLTIRSVTALASAASTAVVYSSESPY